MKNQVEIIVTTPNCVHHFFTSKKFVISVVAKIMKENGFWKRPFSYYNDKFGNVFYYSELLEICVCTPNSSNE